MDDTTETEFACEFLHSLGSVGRDQGSGLQARLQVRKSLRGWALAEAQRAPMKHLASGAVDYVCLLSQDGDEFPGVGR